MPMGAIKTFIGEDIFMARGISLDSRLVYGLPFGIVAHLSFAPLVATFIYLIRKIHKLFLSAF